MSNQRYPEEFKIQSFNQVAKKSRSMKAPAKRGC
jgi:hypothetical protein